ncbi:odorant receptor 10-like [Megachile rotundata]|uniref:odorant receptor 10-like n=1 Tax=Megachile rotundata TaxID=143995 RepID=UPI003FD1B066
MHVVSQFRMLQYRIMNCWVCENKQKDTLEYVNHCSAAMKECVRQHQSLILFCEKLENVFTFTIFWHMVIFSLLVGLNCYIILLADTPFARKSIFMFHVIGSFVHLIIFAYCCNGLMEESLNVCSTIYFGSWNTLPMNRIGRMLRLNVRMIMLRSMKPCYLTAGGFFPVSLETATSLLSSTFSYFTLMRERFLRNDNQ